MSKISRQSGLSLTQLLIASVLIAIAALLIIKLAPEYADYYKILSSAKAVAKEANGNPNVTVTEVRASMMKRLNIDSISDFSVSDFDISKNSANQVEIDFAYQRIIPLFYNVSLMIDFRGSSAD